MFADLGRTLIVFGAMILLLGLILTVVGRVPGLGRLPGDITIQRDNFSLFAPCGTMILLSIVLTLALNIVARLLR